MRKIHHSDWSTKQSLKRRSSFIVPTRVTSPPPKISNRVYNREKKNELNEISILALFNVTK